MFVVVIDTDNNSDDDEDDSALGEFWVAMKNQTCLLFCVAYSNA